VRDAVIGIVTDGTNPRYVTDFPQRSFLDLMFCRQDHASEILGLGMQDLISGMRCETGYFYRPMPVEVWNQALIDEKVFSMVLSDQGEKLAFGGLPAGVVYEDQWVRAPVLRRASSLLTDYGFWAINVNGAHLKGVPGFLGHMFEPIVDTRAHSDYLDDDIVDALGSHFDPPARKFPEAPGIKPVHCNATAPKFRLQIGGHQITYKRETLIALFRDFEVLLPNIEKFHQSVGNGRLLCGPYSGMLGT
jgi:hypothetical protein